MPRHSRVGSIIFPGCMLGLGSLALSLYASETPNIMQLHITTMFFFTAFVLDLVAYTVSVGTVNHDIACKTNEFACGFMLGAVLFFLYNCTCIVSYSVPLQSAQFLFMDLGVAFAIITFSVVGNISGVNTIYVATLYTVVSTCGKFVINDGRTPIQQTSWIVTNMYTPELEHVYSSFVHSCGPYVSAGRMCMKPGVQCRRDNTVYTCATIPRNGSYYLFSGYATHGEDDNLTIAEEYQRGDCTPGEQVIYRQRRYVCSSDVEDANTKLYWMFRTQLPSIQAHPSVLPVCTSHPWQQCEVQDQNALCLDSHSRGVYHCRKFTFY